MQPWALERRGPGGLHDLLSSVNELVAKLGFEMEIEASRPGVLARGPLGTVARRGGGPGLSEAEDAHGSQSRSGQEGKDLYA